MRNYVCFQDKLFLLCMIGSFSVALKEIKCFLSVNSQIASLQKDMLPSQQTRVCALGSIFLFYSPVTRASIRSRAYFMSE